MKIWLVGSGYWGSKIVAVLNKLNVAHEIIDIRMGQTIDDINTLDPVMLATPLWNHYEQAEQLIARGHDVYIEKPAAETADQVQDLIRLKSDNQVVMVGHIFMFNPLLKKLKEIMDSGQLGHIHMIESVRHNMGIYQTKTTPLLSLAPHDFSILHYLTEGLYINNGNRYYLTAENSYPDRIQLSGITLGDYHWNIDVSWFSMERKRLVTVIGERGQAVWDEDKKSLKVYQHRIKDKKLIQDGTLRQSYLYDQDCLELEVNHFVECINNRQNPLTDLNQALSIALYIDEAHRLLNITI
jgi:hypothetical protein